MVATTKKAEERKITETEKKKDGRSERRKIGETEELKGGRYLQNLCSIWRFNNA